MRASHAVLSFALLGFTTMAYADDRAGAEKKKQAGDTELAAGRSKEALAHYQAAQNADPTFLPAFDAAAPLWFSLQDYKTAIARLETAVARRADYSMGWYNLAFAYRKTKDYRKAVVSYQKFVQLRPGEPDPFYGLGVTYKAMGDAAAAKAAFLRYAELEKRAEKQKFVQQAQAEVASLEKEAAALAQAPVVGNSGRAAAVALVGEGDAKRYAGDAASAEAKYREAAKADPSYGAAYRGLGVLLLTQKKIDAAILELETAVAVDASDDVAWYQLAHARRKFGKYAEAATAYRKYIDLKPDNPDPYYGLGQALLQVGDKQGARVALTQYIVLEQRPSEDQWVFKAKDQLASLDQEEKDAVAAAAPAAAAPAATSAAAVLPSAEAPAVPTTLPTAPPLPEASKLGAAPVAPVPPQAPEPAPPAEAPQETASHRFTDASPATFLEKGDELFAAKRYPDAASAYREAIRLLPSHLDARYRLGVSLASEGDLPAAISAWEGVLLFEVGHEKARRNIELARRRLERTGKVEAPDPDAALARARGLLGQERYASAEAILTGFLADPSQAKNIDALSLRAEALFGTGDARSAARDWLAALGLDPRRPRIYRGLADAYRLLGEKSRARYFYEQYLLMAAGQEGEAQHIPVAKKHIGSLR